MRGEMREEEEDGQSFYESREKTSLRSVLTSNKNI